MTRKQKEAYQRLIDKNGRGVVLHVSTGEALVRQGKAVRLDTTGHGKALAEYRAL